jgi:tripartite-type tricarboxylate transporter receptor subunit TctC
MNNHSLSSRRDRRLLLAGLTALIAVPTLAATPVDQSKVFPRRPVTIIVPFAAGGPTDLLARIIAEVMSKDLGQPVIIENVPGAGGTVGNARAARAAPDGYTLLIGNVGTLAASPTIYKKLSYNVLTDFIPLGSIADAPQVVSARKDLPVVGLDQLAEYLKIHAGKLDIGAAGLGSGSYLGAVLLNAKLGVKVNIVNYRGAGQALNDVIAGHIDFIVDSTTTSAGYIKSGAVKGVVVLRPKRIKALPDVPAAGESGFPDLHYDIWNMMLAPKGTPAATVARLHKALLNAINSPQTHSRLEPTGVQMPSERHQTQEGAAELLAASVVTWRALAAELGVMAD